MVSIVVKFVKRFRRDQLILAALVVFAAIQLPYKLTQFPPFWWDEGNVASWARNWVVLGHYGRLLAGRPLPENLSALTVGFPAIAPIALSFRLLGIGVWQARLPGVLFTVGALAALWLLARRLYDRSVATLTLGAALLLPVLPELHPVVMGRQALGEMPAVFYLLMGLLFLQRAWGKPRRFLPPAVLFWGLSLQTKPQVIPFLTAALLLPLALLLRKRRFREARILGVGLLGSLVTSVLLARVCSLVLGSGLASSGPAGSTFAAIGSSPTRLLFNVFQLDSAVRLEALYTALLTATPMLLGLSYVGYRFWGNLDRVDTDDEPLLGCLVLWTLTASWFSWYVLLSIGWLRYLFPAAFLGSVFTAALIHRLTDGLTLPPWKRWAAARTEPGLTISKIGTLASLLVLPIAFLLTVYYTYGSLALARSSSALLETARFLNTETRPDALIEMGDRELFFLVERAYHYPHREAHSRLKRRVNLSEDVTIDYDPLAADPDYLVVGPYGRAFYYPIVETDLFYLVHASERYLVYQRVRAELGDEESGG